MRSRLWSLLLVPVLLGAGQPIDPQHLAWDSSGGPEIVAGYEVVQGWDGAEVGATVTGLSVPLAARTGTAYAARVRALPADAGTEPSNWATLAADWPDVLPQITSLSELGRTTAPLPDGGPVMAYRDSTSNTGKSATPSVAVPSGVQSGDIVILIATIDQEAAVFETADWPSGFTELAEVDNTIDGNSSAVGWKRLSGADSGSYTFGAIVTSGLPDWACQAIAFSGRHATNDPTVSSATNNSANTNPVTVTASGVTAVAGDDLVWISAPDVTADGIGNGHTAPTNFTEAEDAENAWANLSIAYRENVSAGATGNVSGTFALSGGTAGWAAFLVRIPVASGSASVVPVLLRQYAAQWK